MPEKFDPAPFDKHAVPQEEASRLDREASNNLRKGLEDSFPASDPVSVTQPASPSTTVIKSRKRVKPAAGSKPSPRDARTAAPKSRLPADRAVERRAALAYGAPGEAARTRAGQE
jgi:hypothetical protein